jgi:hypothetical protein
MRLIWRRSSGAVSTDTRIRTLPVEDNRSGQVVCANSEARLDAVWAGALPASRPPAGRSQAMTI